MKKDDDLKNFAKWILTAACLFSGATTLAQDVLFDSATTQLGPPPTARRFRSLSAPAAPATSQIVAPDAVVKAPKKVVLTRLEALYEGAIRDRGDAISVELETGGAISVSKLDVLFVGNSREEAFEFQKNRTRLDDANDVLRLADWANRRRLGPQGIALIETALAASNDDAERRAFERKLTELRESEKIREEIARTIAVRDASKNAADGAASADGADAGSNAVDDELEIWAKQVPFAAFERFGRKAQPILQKRCATSDCHDGSNPAAAGFALQPKARGAATRLSLLRNLRETFDFVDFANPSQSPILTHPVVVDANGRRVYPFGEDRGSVKDRDAFVAWVSSLDDGKLGRYVHAPSRSRVAERVAAAPSNAAAPLAAPSSNVDGEPAAGTSFATLFDSAEPSRNDDVIRLGATDAARKFRAAADDPNSAEAALRRVGALPERTYRDEYDPAIFNARYQTGDATRRY